MRLQPPDLIIQDELHLISDALGSMVGLYETAIHTLCTRVQDGRTVRPVLVASTATVRRAKDQVEQVFARGLSIFPPQVLDAGDFTSTRELAGMRRLVEDDIADRLASLSVGTARVPDDQRAHQQSEQQDASTLADLERPFDPRFDTSAALAVLRGPDRDALRAEIGDRVPALDVLLATSMLQVGVDVQRLGLMLVTGQPKSTAEYIQATSRVGRDRGRRAGDHPVPVESAPRPCPLRASPTTTPRSGCGSRGSPPRHSSDRALDRGLSGVLAAAVRQTDTSALPNTAAGVVPLSGPAAAVLLTAFVTRAERVTHSPAQVELVRQQVQNRLDQWQHVRARLPTVFSATRRALTSPGSSRRPTMVPGSAGRSQ